MEKIQFEKVNPLQVVDRQLYLLLWISYSCGNGWHKVSGGLSTRSTHRQRAWFCYLRTNIVDILVMGRRRLDCAFDCFSCMHVSVEIFDFWMMGIFRAMKAWLSKKWAASGSRKIPRRRGLAWDLCMRHVMTSVRATGTAQK